MGELDKFYVISDRSLEHLCDQLNSIENKFEVIAYTQEFGVTKLLLQNKE